MGGLNERMTYVKVVIVFHLYLLEQCLNPVLWTSIKTCNFVTFYKFLIHLGMHHTNNSQDVLAALHLMVMLQLENFLVCGNLSHICNSQMRFLKMSSNGQLTNHNSFGRVNKKFARFIIDFISVQLVFNSWYPSLTRFAPSPFA